MRIQENIPLAPLTTFRVGGPARFFVEARREEEVREAVDHARSHGLPLFVLGGGSNLVVADAGWPGLVLKMAITGATPTPVPPGKILFEVGAGEDWDGFVAAAVERNCAGIECLSGIPGTAGGTPIQNVGAYGQEVSETITAVRVLDLETGQIRVLSNADCRFHYRSSIFNTEARGRYIVLRVSYALEPGGPPRFRYADLVKYFAGRNGAPTLAETRQAVRAIRHGKAMLIVEGDEDCRSAGSFFKNPIVSEAKFRELEELLARRGLQLPHWPANGAIKVSAAFLVEQSGFPKGFSRGAVGISRKHALAIVNRGGATAAAIVALKNEIQKAVAGEFGVELQPEPVFVGC